LVALALAVAAVAAGGGGGDAAPPPAADEAAAERPVSDDEALVLARLLVQNRDRGGARFTGHLDVRGVEIPLRGRVDFRSGRGTATLREPGAASRRYVWTRRTVYAQAAPGTPRYTRQRPDPDHDPVHAAIAFINLLAAETIDNTTNIRDQGARHVGRESLGGRSVDVFDYGDAGRTTYWVDREERLLRQVRARFPDAGDLVVTLTEHAPQRVALPARHRARAPG
jgi:hypothetical protein